MKRAVSHVDASAAASQLNHCSRSAAASHPRRSPRAGGPSGCSSVVGGPKLKRCKSACINLKRLANPSGSPSSAASTPTEDDNVGRYMSTFLPRWRQHASSPDVSMTFASTWFEAAGPMSALPFGSKSRANGAATRLLFNDTLNIINTADTLKEECNGDLIGMRSTSAGSVGGAVWLAGSPTGCSRDCSFASALNSPDPVPEGEVSLMESTPSIARGSSEGDRHHTTPEGAASDCVDCGSEYALAYSSTSDDAADLDLAGCNSPCPASAAAVSGGGCFSIVGFGDVDLEEETEEEAASEAADCTVSMQQQQLQTFGRMWGGEFVGDSRGSGPTVQAPHTGAVGASISYSELSLSETPAESCDDAGRHNGCSLVRQAAAVGGATNFDASNVGQRQPLSSQQDNNNNDSPLGMSAGEREPQSAMLMMRLQRKFEDMMLVSRVAT